MKNNLIKIFWLMLLTGAVFFLYGQSSDAEFKIRYDLLSGSSIGFNGSSSINTFYCGSASLEGSGWGVISPRSGSVEDKEAELVIAVKELDCGAVRMNRDMYNALKSDNHPIIKFELLKASLTDKPGSTDEIFFINTTGNLTVAGKTKKIQISFKIEKIFQNNYRIRGSKKLSMYDFGITPPSALFGLIKADDILEVKFDLTAMINLEPNIYSVP